MKDYFENLEQIEENFNYMCEHHGEIYNAYEQYGRLVHEKGGPLEEKCRWLIKIAVSATCQYEYALSTHIFKALRCGCTREEIEHALLLVAPTAGFPSTMKGLLVLRNALEHLDKIED